jgi:hypothetical protein
MELTKQMIEEARPAEPSAAAGSVREALTAFVAITESGVRTGLTDMDTLEGRIAWYDKLAGVRKNAVAALEPAARSVPAEIERLRAGLQWYADGHHYDLDGWEDCSGESSNWLFPPSEHSWMVDDGGIAGAILQGQWINPNHADADNITIPSVTNAKEHEDAMTRIDELMPSDPSPDTPAGRELSLLATLVEIYEKEHFPIAPPSAQDEKGVE